MAQTQPVEQMTLLEAERNIRPAPFLKWAGGKSQLLEQFEAFFPHTFGRYYEPFVGGGAVFFHLQPADAVLSDANPNLVAAYKHVQCCVDDLLALLYELRTRYHAMSFEQQAREYYQVRTLYNRLPTGSLEKTAYLIFLNKTGYNGLYRESKRGGYNVPFGRYDNPAIFDETNLRAASHALQHAEILTMDFSAVVHMAQAGDFVYFDPPYMPVSKTASFTSYTKGDFGREEQTRLAEVARQLAQQGVQVMLSNSKSELIRALYKDFYQYEVQASRAVNSKADLRGKITELVITSYKV